MHGRFGLVRICPSTSDRIIIEINRIQRKLLSCNFGRTARHYFPQGWNSDSSKVKNSINYLNSNDIENIYYKRK